jgi:hypothetical protein
VPLQPSIVFSSSAAAGGLTSRSGSASPTLLASFIVTTFAAWHRTASPQQPLLRGQASPSSKAARSQGGQTAGDHARMHAYLHRVLCRRRGMLCCTACCTEHTTRSLLIYLLWLPRHHPSLSPSLPSTGAHPPRCHAHLRCAAPRNVAGSVKHAIKCQAAPAQFFDVVRS